MDYALGTSDRERERLELQARLFDPYTRRFLRDAGVGAGKTVLDIGTGAGDVALLAADLVEREGAVHCVDIEPRMIEHARQRAASRGIQHATFQTASAVLDDVEGSYDVVVARLVLLFQPDKPALLRRAAQLVRPGGTLAIIESAWTLTKFWSCPPVPSYDGFMDAFVATVRRLEIATDVGTQLAALFAEAGLPEPQFSAELLTGGATSGIVDYNLMNGEVTFGQARAASVACPTQENFAAQRDEILQATGAARAQYFGPCLIGARATIP